MNGKQKPQTEMRNPYTTNIDKMTTAEMLECIQRENENATQAVRQALPSIEKACDCIATRLAEGGRLFYIGAGTSGRLGVIDAAECPPTFGVPQGMVIGIIAGGSECMFGAAENEEDDATGGVRDLQARNLTAKDVVVGISAAGNAAYVVAALEYANDLGCATVGITSNNGSKITECAQFTVVAETGAEVVTGSTRMKAGTAQKLILNMFSTVAMIKLGHVYENMMINLRPSNEKLTKRVIGIVEEITGLEHNEAKALLEMNDWNIRKSVDAYRAANNAKEGE